MHVYKEVQYLYGLGPIGWVTPEGGNTIQAPITGALVRLNGITSEVQNSQYWELWDY
jgi:hypothetical protein